MKLHRTTRNWPLILGGSLVLLTICVALFGPSVAPRGPLDREAVLIVGEQLYPPPFPAFVSPDFPLGSDGAGRDTLSRLLWAIRPTMLMVMVVASVRLLLGVSVGLLAGWSYGTIGRIAQSLLTMVLSVPPLIVALVIVVGVGTEQGLTAFVLGLGLIGWGETAQLVAARTRVTASQPFVLAARALGASEYHLLKRHALRQVTPLLGMLWAFEISSTLLLTGALGFLGYYIGGGIVYQMDDGVRQRFTDLPELGQMLSTALESTIKPGQMLVIGSVVVVMTLGFTLFGEGLRQVANQDPGESRWPIWLEPWRERLSLMGRRLPWLLTGAAMVVGLVLLGVGLGFGGETASSSQPTATIVSVESRTVVPTVAQGPLQPDLALRYTAQALPSAPVIRWSYATGAALSGGPAFDAQGQIYLATGAQLESLSSEGVSRWKTTLPAEVFGTPAVSTTGMVYVVDRQGGVSAVASDGTLTWRAKSPTGREATSSPSVMPDGTIVYVLVDQVVAFSPNGQQRWVSSALGGYITRTPLSSFDGQLVYVERYALRLADGQRQELAITATDKEGDDFLVLGADQRNYLVSSGGFVRWERQTETLRQQLVPRSPAAPLIDVGVLPDGTIWAHCSGAGRLTAICWYDQSGKKLSSALLSAFGRPDEYRNRQVAVGAAGETAYFCGAQTRGSAACVAVARGATDVLWRVELPAGQDVVGAVIHQGQLYVALAEGSLVVLGAP